MTLRCFVSLAFLTAAATACGSDEPPPPPRTAAQQRVVDSTVGATALPGAQGVRGALAAADSAAARAALHDSLARNP